MRDAYRPKVKSLVDGSLGLASLVLTTLAFTAFEPLLPDPAFDGSWRYAVATAAARSMPFGREFAFTFGPLGILYSGFRLASQDALYLGLHVLLSVGLFAGFLLSARPAMRSALILLPVAVAASAIPDAMFFVLPFSLVVGCVRRNLSPLAWGTTVVLLAACDGVLPLIKGTMALPVGACTLIAAGLTVRERSRWALAIPTVTAAAFLASWSIAGQRLSDISNYLSSQSEIAAGYTDAMSICGPVGGVVSFVTLAAAFVALWAAAVVAGRRIAVAMACACTAFVAFKAGFVRDDGHSLIAASALLLLGVLLFLHAPPRLSILGLAFGIGGWVWVAQANTDVSPRAVALRLADAVSSSARSVAQRVRDASRTFAAFERRRAEIADGFERPDELGRYDVYPIDQTPLLASELPWGPRPIVQSYSAYTPALAAMNAAHLVGPDAPDHIMFDVRSLDNRYPSLDDGSSWPSLLSHYDHRGFLAGTSHLARSAVAHPATIEAPFLSRSVAFGENVALPDDESDGVWTRLEFHPSLAGHLASALFKAPLLFIDVTLRDGTSKTYRMVAGEGAAGFLLSPIIASARDFVALKLGAGDLLSDRSVRSFRIRQGVAYPFWGLDFHLTLSRLEVTPDPNDNDDLRGTATPGPPLTSIPIGGECALDSVAGQVPDEGTIRASSSSIPVEGWAMLSTAARTENDGVRLAIVDSAGHTFYAPGTKVTRHDLDTYFELPPNARIAFSSTADLRARHGNLNLSIVQDSPNGPVQCPTGVSVVLP